MIDKISKPQTPFTGKSFRDFRTIEDFAEESFEAIKKRPSKVKDSGKFTNACRAYANITEKPNKVILEKKIFGYGTRDSVEVKPYLGTTNKEAGLSTEKGGYGGGYIKANLQTPLSTSDIHTCATMHLVDEANKEHFLYHVYSNGRNDSTGPKEIENFLRKEFPSFNSVNIISGDRCETVNTVNDILSAINNINKKAEKHFYHFATENPEIVACDKKLSYIDRKNDEMTFKEVKNNFT